MHYLNTQDGIKLSYQIKRADEPKCCALLCHGYGEHSLRYKEFTDELNSLGISVLTFDFRGHGYSEGLAGHIYKFTDYLEDIRSVVSIFEKELTPQKRILFAHSNGALIATHALADLSELKEWDAVIFSSPFFGLQLQVPLWKRVLAHTLSTFYPTFRLPTGSNAHLLSHDPNIEASMNDDPMIVQKASARWFTETLKAQRDLEKKLSQIQLSSLWQVAGDDHIVNSMVTTSLFDSLSAKDKLLYLYPNCYHELWFEAQDYKFEVMTNLAEFLMMFISPEMRVNSNGNETSCRH